jgi:gamma-glutamyl-gamma-aminobutyraldehyde dehydrogenase
MADADLAEAASAIAWGIYYNAGETCHAGSRLIVHEQVRAGLIDAIERVARTITLGHPFDPATQMGALIDSGHLKRVLAYIDSGIAEGAHVAFGGRQALRDSGGYYVEATVLDAVQPHMRVSREEIFGPVLAVMPFDTEEEAVALANDNVYGLGGYVHTSDLRRAHRVAQQLDAGYIGINSFGPHTPATPFGGNKASGWGREGGSAGLNEFLKLKNIYAPL